MYKYAHYYSTQWIVWATPSPSTHYHFDLERRTRVMLAKLQVQRCLAPCGPVLHVNDYWYMYTTARLIFKHK